MKLVFGEKRRTRGRLGYGGADRTARTDNVIARNEARKNFVTASLSLSTTLDVLYPWPIDPGSHHTFGLRRSQQGKWPHQGHVNPYMHVNEKKLIPAGNDPKFSAN